jgi:hypothetical protein
VEKAMTKGYQKMPMLKPLRVFKSPSEAFFVLDKSILLKFIEKRRER